MRCLYSLFIRLYSVAIAVASLWNEKAKLLHSGRGQTFDVLKRECAGKQVVWLHAASLGEYEQGKPLIQKMREKNPEFTFLVTFFSPSGYEIKKHDADIDIVVYLPADTKANVKRFLQIVQPKAAFFVKYEYWFNFIQGLACAKIPFYYVSAIFRPNQYFFKPIGKWFAKQLRTCTHFFVQNDESRRLLQKIGITQVTVTGDTRFDRVHAIAQKNEVLSFVEQFQQESKLWVAGSTWAPDEQILQQVFAKIKSYNYKLILAPHVIDKEHITTIQQLFSNEKVVLYSEIQGKNLAEYNVLVIDAIGFLSKIYKYAHIAHIGGAFATGLHNTLEAAVFGIPLSFGPRYAKFQEAVELVRRKGAYAVNSVSELEMLFHKMEEEAGFYDATCQICAAYVQENLGASEKILQNVQIR